MKVWLVRHGDAVPDTVDAARPLSSAGRAEVEAVAALLARSGKVRPRTVVHSDKTRARQTAEILAAALGASDGLQQADGLAPEADPAIWAGRLGDADGVMVVGHMPHMEGLLGQLIGAPDESGLVRLVTATVVCLSREPGQPTWSMAWMVTPAVASGSGGSG